MKKVLVICGTGVATSTMVMNKLKEFFEEKQINVQLHQSKVSDVLSTGNDYDVIVSTTVVPPRGCPKSRLNRPWAQPFFLFLGYKKIVLFYRMKLTKKHSTERTISYE